MRRARRLRAARGRLRGTGHADRRRAAPALRAAAAVQGRAWSPTSAGAEVASPTPERLRRAGHRLHRPARAPPAIDRAAKTVRFADGTSLPYDRLLLATGARPRRLPLARADGAASPICAPSTTRSRIRDALGPGGRVAIVGGGFIGLELAASGAQARRRGHRHRGAAAHPDARRAGGDRRGRRGAPSSPRASSCAAASASPRSPRRQACRIALADGRAIDADLVVIGIGAVPVTALAEAAGLALDNGIAVDDRAAHQRSRTSSPPATAARFRIRIYGGRRVRLEVWRNAQEQGTLAARNMLGAGEPISAVPWFWSDQYDLTLQIAGLAEGAHAAGPPRARRRRLRPLPPRAPTAGCSPPAASARATRSPRTSGWPKC